MDLFGIVGGGSLRSGGGIGVYRSVVLSTEFFEIFIFCSLLLWYKSVSFEKRDIQSCF